MASFGQHFMSTSTPKEATKTKKISTADKRQAAHKSAAEPAPLKVYPVLIEKMMYVTIGFSSTSVLFTELRVRSAYLKNRWSEYG